MDCWVPFTTILIKEVSIPEFGKINFAFGVLELYVKLDVKRDPSWIAISSKEAIPSNTGTVISLTIENTKDWFPKVPEVEATGPFLSVIDAGVGLILLQSMKKLTVADADFLDLGTYPIFRAKETTFSLKVALSMNT